MAHKLPDLHYAFATLESHIDMHPALASQDVEQVRADLPAVPEAVRNVVNGDRVSGLYKAAV
jgi:hypothetical protein